MKKTLSAIALAALGSTALANDPHLWLEEVEGKAQLDWVRERNQRTENELTVRPGFAEQKQGQLEVLDSNDKIPYVAKRGAYFYNFWQDKNNPQGLWRRTPADEFRKENPKWEVLLDLDALNKAEGENWVWHGSACLPPEFTKCLLALSRGGADADVTREFDIDTRSFVKDGFYRPEAKGALRWIDKDSVYVYTDFGEGSQTDSGYARQVKVWKRGTPLSQAELVFEGEKGDVMVRADHVFSDKYPRDVVIRATDFYSEEWFVRHADGKLQKIDVPDLVDKDFFEKWLIFKPREDWTVNGKTYAAGSYLVTDFADWLAGKRELTVLFEPTERSSLDDAVWTKSHVVLNILEDVRNRLVVLTPGKDGWKQSSLSGLPENSDLSVRSVEEEKSDELLVTASGYTMPPTLYWVNIGEKAQKIKSTPDFYDSENYRVVQKFATSKDGTRVPYFMVHHKDMKADGKNPTMLYGYGGFEVSLKPYYAGTAGRGWLQRRTDEGRYGVMVVANIRGGGEYGPGWHQAALKEKRHKAYEDFAAVAQDLIRQNITAPAHLGAKGGSNGGLLTGNMLTQYPELFGGIVVQVPLLDMQRYNKLLAGASWMAEYGNPDKPEEWAYIQTFSPYHLFDAAKNYPPVLFTTSTRDDRVHPAHARKMMAKMEAAGKTALYYENIEGGHGGAANNAQRAHMNTLENEFLWRELSK